MKKKNRWILYSAGIAVGVAAIFMYMKAQKKKKADLQAQLDQAKKQNITNLAKSGMLTNFGSLT